MIDPVDEDERAQLLRELLLERFGPIPHREAPQQPPPAERARAARRRIAERRRVLLGLDERRRAA